MQYAPHEKVRPGEHDCQRTMDPALNEPAEISMSMRSDVDVLRARQYGSELARALRFTNTDRAMIAIVISEIARNAVLYAVNGCMQLTVVTNGNRRGLRIVSLDEGPGIADLDLVMQDGYTTSRGLGIGLPGAKRLMDEFAIVSEVGKGTTITMTKWEQG